MKVRFSVALLVLALAPPAFAQIIYRSTMPDGRTVLSDKPTPGAKKVEEYYVRLSPQDVPRFSDARPAPVTAPDAGTASSGGNRDAELDAAILELRNNENALRAAQSARAAAEEPLEGERQGMMGGGSRLNERYFERLKGLDDAIDQLRRRVDEAQAKVNSLR